MSEAITPQAIAAAAPRDAGYLAGLVEVLEKLPRRREKISGQPFSYIKLEDAVDAIRALPPPAALDVYEAAPEPGPWVPPEDRPYNYECLGWIYGGWDFVFWVDDHWQTRRGNRCNPAAFLRLPPAPFPSAQDGL